MPDPSAQPAALAPALASPAPMSISTRPGPAPRPAPAPRTQSFILDPAKEIFGQIKAINQPNAVYAAIPGEGPYAYLPTDALHLSNIAIVGYRTPLLMQRPTGWGASLLMQAPDFEFGGFDITGDGGLLIRAQAPGGVYRDLTTAHANGFLWTNYAAAFTRIERCAQMDRCGGQWIYCFSDAMRILSCRLPFGSQAEEPIRFDPDGANPPPVDCLVDDVFINHVAGPANLQKSAFAVREGRVTVQNSLILGAISAGQRTGANTVDLTVLTTTIDHDPIYASISTQSGVSLHVHRNRFRDSQQPISVGQGSALVDEGDNTIAMTTPPGPKLIAMPDGSRVDGTRTVRVSRTVVRPPPGRG